MSDYFDDCEIPEIWHPAFTCKCCGEKCDEDDFDPVASEFAGGYACKKCGKDMDEHFAQEVKDFLEELENGKA